MDDRDENDHPEKRKFDENEEDIAFNSNDSGGPEKKKQTYVLGDDSLVKSVIVNASMDCPSSKVGVVIGKSGYTINEIMKRSDCKIVIDSISNDGGKNRKVHITGPADGLALAMSMISKVISDGPASVMINAPKREYFSNGEDYDGHGDGEDAIIEDTDFICPANKVGMVVGTKGATATEIYKKTGCKVHILFEESSSEDDKIVKFTGNSRQIKEAKKIVEGIINEGLTYLYAYNPLTNSQDPIIKDIMEINPSKVGAVIGSKGSVIQEIMNRSVCKILVEQASPDDTPKVIFHGTESQIEKAKLYVEDILRYGTSTLLQYDRHVEIISQDVNLYQSQLDDMLAHNSNIFDDIHRTYRVIVTSKNPSHVIASRNNNNVMQVNIMGDLNSVQRAVRYIYQILDSISMGGSAPMTMGREDDHSYMHTSQMSSLSLRDNPYSRYDGGGPSSQYHERNSTVQGRQGSHGSHGQYGTKTTVPVYQGVRLSGSREGKGSYQDPYPTAPGTFSLGADGSAGLLESPQLLADGMHMQIAEIRREFLGKIIGKGGTTLMLIRNKSGASLHLTGKPNDPGSANSESSKLTVAGLPECVALATQMVQEILVNGIDKVAALPDRPPSVSAIFASTLNPRPSSNHYAPPAPSVGSSTRGNDRGRSPLNHYNNSRF